MLYFFLLPLLEFQYPLLDQEFVVVICDAKGGLRTLDLQSLPTDRTDHCHVKGEKYATHSQCGL